MTISEAYLGQIASCFTPEVARRIVEWRPDQNLDERLQVLREKADEGVLSDDDQAEYAEFVEALDFVGILKEHLRKICGRHV